MATDSLKLIALPGQFAVCRLNRDAPIPTWVPSGDLFSVTRTADELSVVCRQEGVPDGIRCEAGWRCLRVAGTLDFSLTGVLASLASPLAEAGISIFVISTFDTDYLLVKEVSLARACGVLAAHGHAVVED